MYLLIKTLEFHLIILKTNKYDLNILKITLQLYK